MMPFAYFRPADTQDALHRGEQAGAAYLGGGTNLVDLMRERIAVPNALVDVSRLGGEIEASETGGLFIGAAATNADVAAHPFVRQAYPLLSEAILNGASPQIRNMATVGGNLLQRTRCLYFYDETARCNKRLPSAGCDAREGHNRMHAILGASEHCVATHPSDMCVALAALDASVHLLDRQGERAVAFSDFHRLPGDAPHVDTSLKHGELVRGVELPRLVPTYRAAYRKVRDRASYAFALVSLAALLDVRDGRIVDVRVALGGVAHKPWRVRRAEQQVIGQSPTTESFERLATGLLKGAAPLRDNAFKLQLARRLIPATLTELAEARP